MSIAESAVTIIGVTIATARIPIASISRVPGVWAVGDLRPERASVSASLDVDTVLREVVEGARALTRARYGAIITIDDAGQPQTFITAGFTPEVHRHLADSPDGPRLFPHFRDLPAPLRVPDLRLQVESLGFASDRIPVKSFQGTRMRHGGMLVGNFFLAEKESGREFTAEDEQILVLLAAQAATAIANARAHQAERRARADLETLIETSPVGVVVFDARTGALVSLNREAKRIVEGLRTAGRSAAELLEVITCQRADGREVSLAEFPLPQQSERGRDGAGRGDRAVGPRWPERQDADQRHAHSLGRRRGRVGGGHPAGPPAAR